MLISADVFICQNKIINDGKRHLNRPYRSWIGNSCDGDTAVSKHVAKVRNRTLQLCEVQVMAFSMLCFTGQCECLLHCEHGCSVDATQLMQLITVECLVMREVGSAAVCVVMLCLRKSVPRALSVVSVTLCYHMFL